MLQKSSYGNGSAENSSPRDQCIQCLPVLTNFSFYKEFVLLPRKYRTAEHSCPSLLVAPNPLLTRRVAFPASGQLWDAPADIPLGKTELLKLLCGPLCDPVCCGVPPEEGS